MDKKKIAEFLVALFIAAIFISSYISLTNYNTPTQQTTTIPQTAYGQGTVSGVITSYSSPLSIIVSCSNSIYNNNTVTNMSAVLSAMENNNSIANFYNSNNNFQVADGNLTSYQLYAYFQKSSNSTRFNCLNFTGPARITLPPIINMTVGTQKVQIPLNRSNSNASIIMSLSKGINTKVKLRIGALITTNGTIYGPTSVSLIQ